MVNLGEKSRLNMLAAFSLWAAAPRPAVAGQWSELSDSWVAVATPSPAVAGRDFVPCTDFRNGPLQIDGRRSPPETPDFQISCFDSPFRLKYAHFSQNTSKYQNV